MDGTTVNKGSVSYKKLRLIEPQSNYIVEKRTAKSMKSDTER